MCKEKSLYKLCCELFNFERTSLTRSDLNQSVLIAVRPHLFPFRTQKLSSLSSKILGRQRPGKIDNAGTKRNSTIF